MTDPAAKFATPRITAGALFVDNGQVLMVHKTYGNGWDIPGGYVDIGESPAAACHRELLEELGLDRPARRLLAVDWAPNDGEGDKILYVFDVEKSATPATLSYETVKSTCGNGCRSARSLTTPFHGWRDA